MKKQTKAKAILFFIPAIVNFIVAGSLFLPYRLSDKIMAYILIGVGLWLIIIGRVLLNPQKEIARAEAQKNIDTLK